MEIDFHHAVTYVCARLAGFKHPDAETIAHCAQYVDDATSSKIIHFENKALFRRISSAHPTFDRRNLDETLNHIVWLPFHFLPGNDGKPATTNISGKFIKKIICRPDSPIARDMVDMAIEHRKRSYGLHRLGVTMHVYADTWAHQGFAGVLHNINEVEDAKEIGVSGLFNGFWATWMRDRLDDITPPLGHGRAEHFPDLPFLKWEYRNGKNELIKRDNPKDFTKAADKICRAMQRYRKADKPSVQITGIKKEDKTIIKNLFETLRDKDGKKRHKEWVKAITGRKFPGIKPAPSELKYVIGQKEGSWKKAALRTSLDLDEYRYKDDFLKSDWKLFQDAIQAHRFHVVHDILPKYGICAA